MNPLETIEETMVREVAEETGLTVTDHSLYAIYSGPRMHYTYPDGNQVVFTMFIFDAMVDSESMEMDEDGVTLRYKDPSHESIILRFEDLHSIDLQLISIVQRPLIQDLMERKIGILRS